MQPLLINPTRRLEPSKISYRGMVPPPAGLGARRMRLEILALFRIFTGQKLKVSKRLVSQGIPLKTEDRLQEEAAPGKRTVYEEEYVRQLFDTIAPRYDLLNHILSSGIDILWRKKAIRLLRAYQPKRILDVATGTADLAMEAARLKPDSILGIDIAPQMLKIGREKIRRKNLGHRITLEVGSAETLPVPDKSFDAVTVAFGVRNFSNLKQGLSEMRRVLKSGGVAMILEFSLPRRAPIKQLYRFYFRQILPWIGGWISRSKEAYRYLPSTVAQFPDGEEFCTILRSVGFTGIKTFPLTLGIATIYLAHISNEEVEQ